MNQPKLLVRWLEGTNYFTGCRCTICTTGSENEGPTRISKVYHIFFFRCLALLYRVLYMQLVFAHFQVWATGLGRTQYRSNRLWPVPGRELPPSLDHDHSRDELLRCVLPVIAAQGRIVYSPCILYLLLCTGDRRAVCIPSDSQASRHWRSSIILYYSSLSRRSD